MLVDAHCHLDEIPQYLPQKDILPVICGHSHSSNLKIIQIAKKHRLPFVLGISPQAAQKEDLSSLDEWMETIRKNKPCAVGEIGLDYHWAKNEDQKKNQLFVFDRMLDLAEELHLPTVLHCRDAGDELLTILENHKTQSAERKTVSAMWHFFSGTEAQAKKALDMGMFLSFPPLPSKSRERAIRLAPLEKILVETDAPAAARSPREITKAIEYVASVKRLSFEDVARQTAKNAARLFNLKL